MIGSLIHCVRQAAFNRLREAQRKLHDAARLKAENGGNPTPSTRALERSALGDMDAADRLYGLAALLDESDDTAA